MRRRRMLRGEAGSARTDTTTAWAQGDAGETKCPTPGMLMIVALDKLDAAADAPARDVSVSKLPEMRSVGMLLATGWCMASGAETLRVTPFCLPFLDAFAWLRHSNDVVGHITTHL